MNKNQREKLTARYYDLLIFNRLTKPGLEEYIQAYYQGRQAMLEEIMDMFFINYHNIKKDVEEELKNETN